MPIKNPTENVDVRTWYINPNIGDDENSGTEPYEAFETFDAVIAVLKEGDVIKYNE